MKIAHYAYFAENQQHKALQLKDALVNEGYLTKLEHLNYNEGQWAVIISVDVADHETATLIEDNIIRIVEQFGAEYDGSETLVE